MEVDKRYSEDTGNEEILALGEVDERYSEDTGNEEILALGVDEVHHIRGAYKLKLGSAHAQ